ncbi:hypothetical protein [Candidatus Igneacidithiobacillus taiwanensis]|uniref:hypothetical protein n=1 Tax=Candidatus Igneacidithiobacillus taiwanensis TaxID=1945924 RepID=UPI0028A245CB|nr:hypothetical protein [Candidatus Igneacidithiobacillus taiwanensis]
MSKPTGLAAFTRKGAASTQMTEVGQEQGTKQGARQRGRGKGDVVALTVRLPRAEWERVHQLAVSEGVSIQSLAVEGLSKIFTEKGLPKLSS